MTPAEKNRAVMPIVSKFVDDLRSVFGEVKVLFAEEGGTTLGKRTEVGAPVFVSIPLTDRTDLGILRHAPSRKKRR